MEELLNTNQIEKLLHLVKVERDLQIHMVELLAAQKRSLEYTKKVKAKAEYLSMFRGQYKEWFKTLDPEVKKVIQRYRQK